MQLVFHVGAHFSEEERLIKCLLRNSALMQPFDTVVPGPGRYRKLLRRTLAVMQHTEPAEDAKDVLLDEILDGQNAQRVLLSDADLLGSSRRILRSDQLYPDAPDRVACLLDLFEGHDVEIFVAVRNPASFLPEVMQHVGPEAFDASLGNADLRSITWSSLLHRIREATPALPITVWCNEDAPVVWPRISREISGLTKTDRMVADFDLLKDIMSEQGQQLFDQYIEERPDVSMAHAMRAAMAFLERFALEEAIDQEIDVPGWTGALVDELTELYEDDMARLAVMPGVRLLEP